MSELLSKASDVGIPTGTLAEIIALSKHLHAMRVKRDAIMQKRPHVKGTDDALGSRDFAAWRKVLDPVDDEWRATQFKLNWAAELWGGKGCPCAASTRC